MRSLVAILFALPLLSAAAPAQTQPQWITGSYTSGNGVLPVANIPWNKYTHINHFAASTSGKGDVLLYDLTQSAINELIASRPPGKKVLLTIKDNDHDLSLFASSASPSNINSFVANIVAFVNNNGYDGVNFDWEKNVDVGQYNQLLSLLRQALPPPAIIALDGNPGIATVAAASQNNLDQVNVMCYDFDWGSRNTWYVGALFQNGNNNVLTCDWDIAQFTNAGVQAAKIGVGVPFYGRRWPGATQPLERYSSPFSRASVVSYRKLVVDPSRWQPEYQFYDDTYKANYLSIPEMNEFDSYTGPEFLRDVTAWARDRGFGGYMAFALDEEFLPDQPGDAAHPLSTLLCDAAAIFPCDDPIIQSRNTRRTKKTRRSIIAPARNTEKSR
jgi:chitinase